MPEFLVMCDGIDAEKVTAETIEAAVQKYANNNSLEAGDEVLAAGPLRKFSVETRTVRCIMEKPR